MDRRKSLKLIAGSVATTALLDACNPSDKKQHQMQREPVHLT